MAAFCRTLFEGVGARRNQAGPSKMSILASPSCRPWINIGRGYQAICTKKALVLASPLPGPPHHARVLRLLLGPFSSVLLRAVHLGIDLGELGSQQEDLGGII